jgi:hypothetical protein
VEEHALVAAYWEAFGTSDGPEKIKAMFPDQSAHRAFLRKTFKAFSAAGKARECAP